jgi:hypothetical protein
LACPDSISTNDGFLSVLFLVDPNFFLVVDTVERVFCYHPLKFSYYNKTQLGYISQCTTYLAIILWRCWRNARTSAAPACRWVFLLRDWLMLLATILAPYNWWMFQSGSGVEVRLGIDRCQQRIQNFWRLNDFVNCLRSFLIWAAGMFIIYPHTKFYMSSSNSSLFIIIMYFLQLGVHPVAVVLTLHNYNKNIQ